MNGIKTIFTIAIIATCACQLSSAENQLSAEFEEKTSKKNDETSSSILKTTNADEIENQASKQYQEEPPKNDNLQIRNIGDALKNFQPSEDISADNAVTFPVDI